MVMKMLVHLLEKSYEISMAIEASKGYRRARNL